MMPLMTQPQDSRPRPEETEILIFTPTPNEHRGVKRRVAEGRFKNFTATVVESGPGKINAAFKIAAEVLPRLARGRKPAVIIGAGTSGSLDRRLASGDLIASSSALISDWKMEDDDSQQHGVYSQFVYRPLEPGAAEEMAITCPDPRVDRLLVRLEGEGFKRGRLLTSDTFVSGLNRKLTMGQNFGCLACDMESGAFAFAAQHLLGGLPWFNLRVVADTLDDNLADYFNKEVDMVEILASRTLQALEVWDGLMDA